MVAVGREDGGEYTAREYIHTHPPENSCTPEPARGSTNTPAIPETPTITSRSGTRDTEDRGWAGRREKGAQLLLLCTKH